MVKICDRHFLSLRSVQCVQCLCLRARARLKAVCGGEDGASEISGFPVITWRPRAELPPFSLEKETKREKNSEESVVVVVVIVVVFFFCLFLRYPAGSESG